MFTFQVQPPGIICVETKGFWTIEEADRYLAELTGHVEKMRREQGYALVLVDGREGVVQAPPVMERVSGIQSILIRDPRDRAAYVVESSLAKLQAQRLSTSEQLKVFLSPSAARTWILAYHAPGAS